MKYLGVPISASRFSKIECHQLVDKILGKMRQWSTRNLSFAGRALLVNTVASIFILPQEIINKINQLCRNFLWRGATEYKKPPPISWDTVCTPKKYGGSGLKNLNAWNKACIAKLVWSVAMKKDMMWVKWVHEKYLKQHEWWSYQASYDSSWSWKNLLAIKDIFKQGTDMQKIWMWHDTNSYTIRKGYFWLLGDLNIKRWSKFVWAHTVTPRHAFIMWITMHDKLPKQRMLIICCSNANGQRQCGRPSETGGPSHWISQVKQHSPDLSPSSKIQKKKGRLPTPLLQQSYTIYGEPEMSRFSCTGFLLFRFIAGKQENTSSIGYLFYIAKQRHLHIV
ncbi:hypothetical protein Cgig2_001140 [Carnegiea gigantea]|uniref:Reverse transcriptase zinc-binding domain-containing protein n=1 Tax=Carnegiea gigantea TaxID=171969 RepID=A0A9Q1JJM6_9CARY|nr:hypothetical protein Cgig2_001140 [Carnegiea gigantea]